MMEEPPEVFTEPPAHRARTAHGFAACAFRGVGGYGAAPPRDCRARTETPATTVRQVAAARGVTLRREPDLHWSLQECRSVLANGPEPAARLELSREEEWS